MMASKSSEKVDAITPSPARSSGSIRDGKAEPNDDAFEVFKRQEGQVDFRTVSWIHASVIFLKGLCPDSTPNTISLDINLTIFQQ